MSSGDQYFSIRDQCFVNLDQYCGLQGPVFVIQDQYVALKILKYWSLVSKLLVPDDKVLVPDAKVLVPNAKVSVPYSKKLVPGEQISGPWRAENWSQMTHKLSWRQKKTSSSFTKHICTFLESSENLNPLHSKSSFFHFMSQIIKK